MIPGISMPIGAPVLSGFPQVEEITETTNSTTTSHTVLFPASYDNGNLFLLFFSTNGTTVSVPAGWTQLINLQSDGIVTSAMQRLFIAGRVMDGSEGIGVNITTGTSRRSASQIYRITRHASGVLAAANTGTDGNGDPPNLTATWGSAKNLWISALALEDGASPTGVPSGFTDLDSLNTGTGDGHNAIHTARRELEAVSLNPSAWTKASSPNWVAATVVVRPGL